MWCMESFRKCFLKSHQCILPPLWIAVAFTTLPSLLFSSLSLPSSSDRTSYTSSSFVPQQGVSWLTVPRPWSHAQPYSPSNLPPLCITWTGAGFAPLWVSGQREWGCVCVQVCACPGVWWGRDAVDFSSCASSSYLFVVQLNTGCARTDSLTNFKVSILMFYCHPTNHPQFRG